MLKQNYNYKKKWYKSRQKIGVGRAEVYLHLILQLSHITAINLIDLEELLSIIKEVWCEENVLL